MLKRIYSIERLNNSVNGNPRYRIAFDDAAASPLTTSSDYGFCYAVGNPDMCEGCLVSVTLTAAGRISDMSPAVRLNCEDCSAVCDDLSDKHPCCIPCERKRQEVAA